MKYINFNRYKFSIIKKLTSINIFNFAKLFKYLDIKKYNINIKKINIAKVTKLLNYIYYNLKKFFDIRNYNLNKIYKYLNFKKKKEISIYIILPLVFLLLVYLSIPKFYNFEKSEIEKIACRNIDIKCSINGKIKYNFLPTPRIVIKNLIFADKKKENTIYGKINKLIIKISILNLIDKKKFKYKEIEIIGSELNINIANLKNIKKLLMNELMSESLKSSESNIKFFDGNKFVTDIKNVNFSHKNSKKKNTSILKGSFLDDEIVIKYKKNTKNKNISKKLLVNLINSNFSAKIELPNINLDANKVEGNILLKKDKNILSGLVKYQNNELYFKNANVRNALLDGKIDGYLKFDPYFDFKLNVNLNSVNFNKIHKHLIQLDDNSTKELFRINKKINGAINLSINKIFSKYTLVNSIESRIKFLNGNIFFEQAIFNLGKLGAVDFFGSINNDNKYSIFNFENNVFIDNKKFFFNKFGVYNKKKIPFNFFTSGSFDLTNLIFRINEITTDTKIADADIKYFEESFNEMLLENGYETLFSFIILKDFIKSINPD
jgi:hypothetical protein